MRTLLDGLVALHRQPNPPMLLSTHTRLVPGISTRSASIQREMPTLQQCKKKGALQYNGVGPLLASTHGVVRRIVGDDLAILTPQHILQYPFFAYFLSESILPFVTPNVVSCPIIHFPILYMYICICVLRSLRWRGCREGLARSSSSSMWKKSLACGR